MEPYNLDEICESIMNNDSLITICQKTGDIYSRVINWIYDSDERKKKYENALEARGEYLVQRILLELNRLSFADRRVLYNEDGSLKKMSEIPDDLMASIENMEIQEEVVDQDGVVLVPRTRKIKLASKLKSLEMLGKHKKMFTDKIEHGGKLSLEALVEGSMAVDDEPEEEEKKSYGEESKGQSKKVETETDSIEI